MAAPSFAFGLHNKFQEGTGGGAASVSWDKLKIELKKIGPSIFFTLLGTAILITSLRSAAEISTTTDTTTYRYFSIAQRNMLVTKMSALDKDVRGLAAYVPNLMQGIVTQQERTNIADLITKLQGRRPDIFEAAFGTESYAKYQDYLNKCSSPASPEWKSAEAGFDRDLLARMKDF